MLSNDLLISEFLLEFLLHYLSTLKSRFDLMTVFLVIIHIKSNNFVGEKLPS